MGGGTAGWRLSYKAGFMRNKDGHVQHQDYAEFRTHAAPSLQDRRPRAWEPRSTARVCKLPPFRRCSTRTRANFYSMDVRMARQANQVPGDSEPALVLHSRGAGRPTKARPWIPAKASRCTPDAYHHRRQATLRCGSVHHAQIGAMHTRLTQDDSPA